MHSVGAVHFETARYHRGPGVMQWWFFDSSFSGFEHSKEIELMQPSADDRKG